MQFSASRFDSASLGHLLCLAHAPGGSIPLQSTCSHAQMAFAAASTTSSESDMEDDQSRPEIPATDSHAHTRKHVLPAISRIHVSLNSGSSQVRARERRSCGITMVMHLWSRAAPSAVADLLFQKFPTSAGNPSLGRKRHTSTKQRGIRVCMSGKCLAQ
jgi:hypothetical protein